MRAVRAAGRFIAGGDSVFGPSALVGLAIAAAAYLVGPRRGDIRADVAMASMAAFLFGLLLAFSIARARDRLTKVQDLVAKSDAGLHSIHQLMAVFPPADCHAVRQLVDDHLTDQIDYRLVDYYLATPSFHQLLDAVYGLQPDTPQRDGTYKELVSLGISMSTDRGEIEATTGQSLSPIEWSGLLLLLVVLFSLIAALPGGTVLGSIVVGLMASALTTLMVLVRKLDLLRWHERVSIWEPTTRLFRSMGLDPYVPREVIDAGRYRPTGTVRVVDYPAPYPDRRSKVVTVEHLSAARASRGA
ncbi:MAG TPA: hypothetical protein VGF87_09155 [Acidimicrobiales bacterium]